MDRRTFLTWSAGGGLALALAPDALAQAAPLSPWIELHPDGTVTLTTTALEMGQGSRTGQAQILADELDMAWDAVKIAQAPETEPYLVEGALFSGGSQTVRTRFDLLRKAGATLRYRLIHAAAAKWDVAPEACEAALGVVTHKPSGRTASYGALAPAAAAIAAPAEVPLKPASQRRYIGKPMLSLARHDKVTGQARYGIDFRLPGMAFAALRQCPHFGGTLESVDEAPALAVPGVRKVVRLKDAIAVVADTNWPALRAAALLEPRWRNPGTVPDSPEIERRLAEALGQPAPPPPADEEQADKEMRERLGQAFAAAAQTHEADYSTSYLAHAPMEPMNATARPTADGVEIWAPTQAPTWAREEVAEWLKMPIGKIVLHPLLIGGGFGRRLSGDYAARAAELALAIGGPVQLLWSREEDMTHDLYRPALHLRMRGAIGSEGALTGYEVRAAGGRASGAEPPPYAIRAYAAAGRGLPMPIPLGAWRGVNPGMVVFARESFIDECAHLTGVDPLTYRDRLLGPNERARRVLRAAAEAIGWGKAKATGMGRGLALLEEWDTFVAHAVEVDASGSSLRVKRIVVAADLGTAVNPQLVRGQFEGGSLMALSAALYERIEMAEGGAAQRNFDTYRVLRMAEAPRVDVMLFDSPEATAIGGAGEPPVPGVAPALANAIFDATAKRIRQLPMQPHLA